MKNVLVICALLIFASCGVGMLGGYVNHKINNDIKYDTIYIIKDDSIKNKKIQNLNFLIDSLKTEIKVRDNEIIKADEQYTKISDDLIVANYKLERIKYYNNAAAKGNNIKFLRGWINRTLKD